MRLKSPVYAVGFVGLALLAPVAQADVVAHWPLDERRGSTTIDVVGDNDGTLLGGATFVPGGVSGGAMSFARATGSLVDFGDIFPFTDNVSYSVSCWIRTETTLTDSAFLARHLSGQPAGYILLANVTGGCYGAPDKALFYTSNSCGGEVVSATSINDGEWHLVVGAYRAGANATIFIDGGPGEDAGAAQTMQLAAATLLLGGVQVGATPTALYDGLIDDVQVYDEALTCFQVNHLFAHPGETAPRHADLNGDGVVGPADLAQLLGQWGPCVDCAEDLNCDGDIGPADLADLLNNWG